MSTDARIVSVNVSHRKGTIKHPVEEIVLDELGVVGDAHAGKGHRQVSLLAKEAIDAFAAETGRSFAPGQFGENLTLSGMDLSGACLLDRLRIGQAELELTQIGKKCHGDVCAIFREVGRCVMPTHGVFCRVVHGGRVRPGDLVEHSPKILQILVITLSDRAFAGQYEDRSGPAARKIVEDFFTPTRWRCGIQSLLLPDDPGPLREELGRAIESGTDVVFTLGGTGVGPRDLAPEAIVAVSEKVLPGIMESIRVKFGSHQPRALLSRSVAAVAGKTQLYALPGSPRAVAEYLGEILKTLEHCLYMLHGLDVH